MTFLKYKNNIRGKYNFLNVAYFGKVFLQYDNEAAAIAVHARARLLPFPSDLEVGGCEFDSSSFPSGGEGGGSSSTYCIRPHMALQWE